MFNFFAEHNCAFRSKQGWILEYKSLFYIPNFKNWEYWHTTFLFICRIYMSIFNINKIYINKYKIYCLNSLFEYLNFSNLNYLFYHFLANFVMKNFLIIYQYEFWSNLKIRLSSIIESIFLFERILHYVFVIKI